MSKAYLLGDKVSVFQDHGGGMSEYRSGCQEVHHEKGGVELLPILQALLSPPEELVVWELESLPGLT